MDVSSYIGRRIDRYIEQVVCQLPRNERREARIRLENNIYGMLENVAGDRTPESRDLHEVLRALGTPDQTAAAYYVVRNKRNEAHREQRRSALLNTNMLMTVLHVLMIFSFVLLCGGLLGLMMHTGSNVGMLFAGCAMALGVQFVREVVLGGKKKTHF